MTPTVQTPVSIWRSPRLAPTASQGRVVAVPQERLPISNLTAGQGKVRLAG